MSGPQLPAYFSSTIGRYPMPSLVGNKLFGGGTCYLCSHIGNYFIVINMIISIRMEDTTPR